VSQLLLDLLEDLVAQASLRQGGHGVAASLWHRAAAAFGQIKKLPAAAPVKQLIFNPSSTRL
jgi:hypothetical protein